MSTINCFEEIISWQEARFLNKNIGKLINSCRFKYSYRLIEQVALENSDSKGLKCKPKNESAALKTY